METLVNNDSWWTWTQLFDGDASDAGVLHSFEVEEDINLSNVFDPMQGIRAVVIIYHDDSDMPPPLINRLAFQNVYCVKRGPGVWQVVLRGHVRAVVPFSNPSIWDPNKFDMLFPFPIHGLSAMRIVVPIRSTVVVFKRKYSPRILKGLHRLSESRNQPMSICRLREFERSFYVYWDDSTPRDQLVYVKSFPVCVLNNQYINRAIAAGTIPDATYDGGIYGLPIGPSCGLESAMTGVNWALQRWARRRVWVAAVMVA
jgi:hypothetical protein